MPLHAEDKSFLIPNKWQKIEVIVLPAKVSAQHSKGDFHNQFWFWMFKDSPINKLLYARDIPRYKQMVER